MFVGAHYRIQEDILAILPEPKENVSRQRERDHALALPRLPILCDFD
jgi:hypothetical protein